MLSFVLAGFALTIIISLSRYSDVASLLVDLGLTSLFVTWVILTLIAFFALVQKVWNRITIKGFVWLLLLAGLLIIGLYSFTISLINSWFITDFDFRLKPHIEFVVLNVCIGFVALLATVRYLIIQYRWKRQIELESISLLAAFQASIRPHFLFNTLNTISSLIHDHPDEAEQATMDLADLLRTSLKKGDSHALLDELNLICGYLRIEQLRLGDRLSVDWEVTDDVALDQQLPPLLLQPLVENAIIHGISRRADGGNLKIEGKRIRFGRIRFTITNPLADPESRPAEGNQSALENIRQRLALAYEERYGLKTRIENDHFIAELTIPVA
ncbi:MAG: sensor histidine kinase [Wenzhouxiangella sp.]